MKLLIILMAVLFTSNAFAQKVETLWRARGLEAEESLEKLKKNKAKLNKMQACEMKIETSFSAFSQKETSLSVIKKNESKTSFLLPILYNKRLTMSVSFIYAEEDKPVLIIPMYYKAHDDKSDFPKFSVMTKKEGVFVLSVDGCIYLFHPDDYLHPIVDTE